MFNFLKKKEQNRKMYKVEGMHCASCAAMIESDLEDAGFSAKCSFARQTVEIEDNGNLDEKKIKQIIKVTGYSLVNL